ncbi:peptidase M50 [Catellatospora citrea]|uniref:peptidase M50 n=1 Tax=Catellatospora citrea TaxID=53366 RepID=UPI0033CBA20B
MSTRTLTDARPRLRGDLLLSAPLQRGPGTVYLVKDPRNGRAFEIAQREHFLISRLDGARSLAQIGTEYAAAFGRRLGDGHWEQLLWLLHGRQLLAGSPADAAAPEPVRRVHRFRLVRDAAAVVDRVHGWVRFAIRGPVVLGVVLACAAMLAVLGLHLPELVDGFLGLGGQPWAIVAVFLLVWVSAALHELAHGVSARHFGCTVSGISMLTLSCTVDNLLYLQSRRRQAAIAASGALVNAAFLLPFAAAWLLLPAQSAVRAPLAGFLLVGAVQALVNLIPLAPLDGYRMLSYALRVTNLSGESRRFLQLSLWRLFGRGPGVAGYPYRAKVTYVSYGLWSAAVILLVGTGLTLICSAPLADHFGTSAAVIPGLIVVLTLAGWLARPSRIQAPQTTASVRGEAKDR